MKETTGADFKSATDSENKKLFIETYGCQMNVADSEVIASIMQMAGYHVCETLDEADAVFMNTCSTVSYTHLFLMLTSSLNPRSKFNWASPLKYWKRISISYGLPASACMA